MIYFTSDLHFRHDRIIKHANRPFRDAEEMDRVLLNNWNNTVGRDDEVYMLGDLTMKGAEVANSLLTKLNGDIHIIRGNHDKFLDQRDFKNYNAVEVTPYKELVYNNTRFQKAGGTVSWKRMRTKRMQQINIPCAGEYLRN